jgi:hypothetical protein
MPTTTNYGWTTPADTDLVKDGASAIRTLGTAIDTTTKNLNPSTTLGDIEYRSSTANTNTRLALGTAGQVLQVNSGATAPEWATISAGGMTLINTGGTTLTGSSVTISSIPATYKNLQLVIRNYRPITDNARCIVRFNADSTANRHAQLFTFTNSNAPFDANGLSVSDDTDNGTSSSLIVLNFYDYANTTTWKICDVFAASSNGATPANIAYRFSLGFYNQTGAISSIAVAAESAGFDSGTAYLYGVS